MKFHRQQFLYDEKNGVRGSCYPTVLACLLDLELGEVPNFQLFYWTKQEERNIIKCLLEHYCNGSYETAEEYQKTNFDRHKSLMQHHWVNTLDYWLASKGYKEEYIPADDMDEWLKNNPGKPYLVKGLSSRGVGHVVIYADGKMIHDPHPSDEGLVSLNNEPYTYLKKVTKVKYITTHIDEFNYVYASNLDAYFSRKKDELSFLHTTTFSEFDIMFNQYDKVYVKKIQPLPGMGAIDSIAADRSIVNNMIEDGIKKVSTVEDSDCLDIISDEDIKELRGQAHVYKYTFSSSAKMLKDKTMKFINPKKSDFRRIQTLLEELNVDKKKVVAINGRNLLKLPGRNQTFKPLMQHLIDQGFFVVNLTINPPGLGASKSSYYEIPNANLTYSDMVSFFLLSDCVLSVADSGGVNVHILTEANFMFLGPGGWIDNPEFGYENTSLLTARKENTDFYTEHLINYTFDDIVSRLKEIPPKKDHYNFFDESIIEFI